LSQALTDKWYSILTTKKDNAGEKVLIIDDLSEEYLIDPVVLLPSRFVVNYDTTKILGRNNRGKEIHPVFNPLIIDN
jgi:hypothetical protein